MFTTRQTGLEHIDEVLADIDQALAAN